MILYTVTATFAQESVAEEWITWLRDGHLADVLASGALDAEVVRVNGPTLRCQVRYHFESAESFGAYERDHAPRLRAEGLLRFGPDRGIAYERSVGEVVARCDRSAI